MLKNHILKDCKTCLFEYTAKKLIVRMSTKLYKTLLKKTEIPIVSPTVWRDFGRSCITLTLITP